MFDCAGTHLGTVVETWSQAITNAFFATKYTITDAAGAVIGTTDGSRFFDSQINVYTAAGGAQVGQLSWQSFRFTAGQVVTIGQWAPTGPSRAEFMVALAQIGFLRYVTRGSSNADQCSRFVIAGVPVLSLLQLAVLCVCCSAASNKAKALVLALALYPGLALAAAGLALGLAATLLYAPLYWVLRRCGALSGGASALAPVQLAVRGVGLAVFHVGRWGEGASPRATSISRAAAASARWGQRGRGADTGGAAGGNGGSTQPREADGNALLVSLAPEPEQS